MKKSEAASPRIKNLTKRTVDAAAADAGRYVIWDDTLKGFGLRVDPTNGKGEARKTFIIRYRAGGGRAGTLRQQNVGRYGTVTVDQARKIARALLGAAQAGGDPIGAAKEKRKAGITVGEVCDWYLAQVDAGRLLGRRGQPIKSSTVRHDRSRIETHIKPLIGRRPVSTLTAQDLEDFQADVVEGKAQKRPRAAGVGRPASGGTGVARRSLSTVSSVFGHAVRKRIIMSNPALGARKLAAPRKLLRLSLAQVGELGAALREADEHPSAKGAIRFMLLSGARISEALGTRYEDLIPQGGLTLHDSKTGAQVRPIGKAALAMAAEHGDGFLFPADGGKRPFVNTPKVLERITKKAGLVGITPHILRHSFASIAGELGYSELTIAGLLGHSAGSVTAGYVHLDASLTAAADRVSAVIAAALDGETAEIVPIGARRDTRA